MKPSTFCSGARSINEQLAKPWANALAREMMPVEPGAANFAFRYRLFIK